MFGFVFHPLNNRGLSWKILAIKDLNYQLKATYILGEFGMNLHHFILASFYEEVACISKEILEFLSFY